MWDEVVELGLSEKHADELIANINRSQTGDAAYGLGEFRAFCKRLHIHDDQVCRCGQGPALMQLQIFNEASRSSLFCCSLFEPKGIDFNASFID